MSTSLSTLERWHSAGLIDTPTADNIRRWEEENPLESRRWLVYVALAFGAVLLASGLFLFVSAHWDQLSPWARFSLVIASVLTFHILAALGAERFPIASVALHTAGTLSLGGAIALTGQIFHLSEHWPAGIMLWALGAVAGWVVLRQWPQIALAAVLIPWWLAGEWSVASPSQSLPVALALLALCLVYLSARQGLGSKDDVIRQSLVWIGGLYLFPVGIFVAVDRWHSSADPALLTACAMVAVASCLAVSVWLRGSDLLPVVVILSWSLILWMIRVADLTLLMYAWYAVGSCLLAWWGILESRPERINLGVSAFALTLICFYFSNVMDKLGRSASLIILGLIFLGGGWLLEQTRRNLIGRMEGV